MSEIVEIEDPPSRPNRAAAGEIALDMELEMAPTAPSSYDEVTSPDVPLRLRRRKRIGRPRRASPPSDQDGSVGVRSTAGAFYHQQQQPPMSGLLGRTKVRSRLMDPPPPAATSVVGIEASSSSSRDDEDPFVVDDIPEDLKKDDFNILIIIQWLSLLLILAALGCSLLIPSLLEYQVWDLHLWKWELMMLVVISGHLFCGWLIRLCVYFLEHNFLFLRKRLLYFLYALRKSVQKCLWLGLVLSIWNLVFHEKVEQRTKNNTLSYVTKFLWCLLIAALLWLVKTLLVKVLASSFHVSTYFDRIQESLFNQYVIQNLSGPPLFEIRHAEDVQKLPKSSFKFSCPMWKKKDFSKEQDRITIDQLHKLNQKNVSAWNMKQLVRIVRYGTLTTLDQQLGHVNGKDESAAKIRTEHQARIAAKNIFRNVAKPGSKYIYLIDLMRFMRKHEALKTMTVFEGAKDNSKVSRKCLKNWVVNAFRERRHLALTLNDTKTAINKLHQMANVIVGIITVSLWLVILDIAKSHLFVVIGSQLLLAVFVFGNTLKKVFEAIIFLFVMHPFDVGDRCEINGVQMVVEEINILTTTFLRIDNQKITCPNIELANLFIGNYNRSPDMEDTIDFCIHVSTPLEKIAIMKQRLISYMESRPEHWYPRPQIVLKEVDDMNRLRISIWMRHTVNFQDMALRWDRRELVMQEMIKVLRELEIEYRMLPVDVNVRNMPPVTSDRLPCTWKTCT